jgi:hypothetical protein
MKFLVFALFIGSAFAYDLEDIIDVIEQHHDVECLVDTKGWDLALRLGMLDSYSGETFYRKKYKCVGDEKNFKVRLKYRETKSYNEDGSLMAQTKLTKIKFKPKKYYFNIKPLL